MSIAPIHTDFPFARIFKLEQNFALPVVQIFLWDHHTKPERHSRLNYDLNFLVKQEIFHKALVTRSLLQLNLCVFYLNIRFFNILYRIILLIYSLLDLRPTQIPILIRHTTMACLNSQESLLLKILILDHVILQL